MNTYSIILPVKNGGHYLKECVNSILAQNRKDFTLTVLDNFSTDGTVEWLKHLNDWRIQICTSDRPLSIENNWARIKDVNKNEFMTIIGHDDLLHPNYLEIMGRLISRHPKASLYQAHFKYIDERGELVRHCQVMKETLFADEFLAGEMKRTMDSMGTGYMMRSHDYDAVGGISPLYPNLIFADYELWMKLIMIGYMAIAAEEIFSYRLHDSVSRLTGGETYQLAFGRYMQFLSGCRSIDPAVAHTIDRYGKQMLLYFCESLSHRLLKTSKKGRTISVGDFIKQCHCYAGTLIPGQHFRPMLRIGIFASRMLDNRTGLKLYKLYKRFTVGKVAKSVQS